MKAALHTVDSILEMIAVVARGRVLRWEHHDSDNLVSEVGDRLSLAGCCNVDAVGVAFGWPGRAVRSLRRHIHVSQRRTRTIPSRASRTTTSAGKTINPERPRDWTAPVDYRNGTVHIRAEVIEKPEGGEPTTWTLCYIPNRGQGNGYGCTGTGIYREKGVYEQDVSMKSFWENDSIIWSEGIKQMDLVIKDNSGGSGHAHKRQGSGEVLSDQGAHHHGPGVGRFDVRSEPGSQSSGCAESIECKNQRRQAFNWLCGRNRSRDIDRFDRRETRGRLL